MIHQINKSGGSVPPFFNDAVRSGVYIAGKYYPPSVNFNSFGKSRLVANSIQYVPFVPFCTHVFTGICVFNTDTGDSGDNIRFAIYNDTGEAKPGEIYGTGGALITLDSTPALRVFTISREFLVGNIYWLAVLSDGNPELQCMANSSTVGGASLFAQTYGMDALTFGTDFVGSTPIGFVEARSYASGMPTTASPDTVTSATNAASPMICLKA